MSPPLPSQSKPNSPPAGSICTAWMLESIRKEIKPRKPADKFEELDRYLGSDTVPDIDETKVLSWWKVRKLLFLIVFVRNLLTS